MRESNEFAAAKRLTQRIKVAADDLWDLIVEAYRSKAWQTLGYATWDAYVTKEFGSLKFRLPKEDRREIVYSLRDNGLSLRAIATATGYDKRTVAQDLRNCAPHLAPCRQRKNGPSQTGPRWASLLRRAVIEIANITDTLARDMDADILGAVPLQDLQRARDALDCVIRRLGASAA